jgi:hypothetical protein
MKKIFLLNIIFIFTVFVAQAQNDEVDIKYLHSAEGKKWIRYTSPDRKPIEKSLHDDVFIFYSNGEFKYDQSETSTPEFANAKTRMWRYNNANNILTMEFYLPNGTTKKYEAQITYIDEKSVVMNLSEDGKENVIEAFVLK